MPHGDIATERKAHNESLYAELRCRGRNDQRRPDGLEESRSHRVCPDLPSRVNAQLVESLCGTAWSNQARVSLFAPAQKEWVPVRALRNRCAEHVAIQRLSLYSSGCEVNPHERVLSVAWRAPNQHDYAPKLLDPQYPSALCCERLE